MRNARFFIIALVIALGVCTLVSCRDDSPCTKERVSLAISTSSKALRVGDRVTVTVELANEGCVDLGLPQYRLYVDSGDGPALLDPSPPEPVAHSLGVVPGEADSATFTLRATGAGRVKLSAMCSYEVHLGYPGPAYWGSVASRRLTLTLKP